MKRQLPPRPNLEQLKKQAKTILKGHEAGDPHTLKRIQEQHPRWRNASGAAIQRAHFTLSEAQRILANEYGFATWSKLRNHILLHGGPFPRRDGKGLARGSRPRRSRPSGRTA